MKIKSLVVVGLLAATIALHNSPANAQGSPNQRPPKELTEALSRKGFGIKPVLGGTAGDTAYSHYLAEGDYITKVTVWYWSAIDAVVVETKAGEKWTIGEPKGKGNRPQEIKTESFTLTQGQYLKSIKVKVGRQNSYTVIKGISFNFEGTGVKSFGEDTTQTLGADVGDEISGFWGWHGSMVDCIGLVTRKRK